MRMQMPCSVVPAVCRRLMETHRIREGGLENAVKSGSDLLEHLRQRIPLRG